MTIKKSIWKILLGSFILAFGLFHFNEQNNITEGGSLGLGLLLNHHFKISPAISLFLMDIAAFALGIKYFGRSFLIKSLLATTSFSIFYGLFEAIGPVIPPMDSKLIAAVLSGLFIGIGAGFVVRTEAASNGDDSIALIVNHVTGLSVGRAYLLMDLIIIVLSLTYLSPFELVYSLIAVTISSFTIEYISTWNKQPAVEKDISVQQAA